MSYQIRAVILHHESGQLQSLSNDCNHCTLNIVIVHFFIHLTDELVGVIFNTKLLLSPLKSLVLYAEFLKVINFSHF